MLVHGPLNLDAQILNQGHQSGQNQQQRHRVSLGIGRGGIDIRNEVPPEDHKARGNQRQNQILHPAHPEQQGRKAPGLVGVAIRGDAVDPGGEDGGNGRRKADEQGVDLRAHAVDRHGLRAGDPAQNILIHGPVDLVDEHIQKQEKAEPGDLPENAEIKAVKPESDMELFDAVPGAYHQLGNSQKRGNADNRHGAEAHEQQGQTQQRIEQDACQRHQLLEKEFFPGGDHGFQQPSRESQGDVHHQHGHQDSGRAHLPGRQLIAE